MHEEECLLPHQSHRAASIKKEREGEERRKKVTFLFLATFFDKAGELLLIALTYQTRGMKWNENYTMNE
jgi:hypothetical protein